MNFTRYLLLALMVIMSPAVWAEDSEKPGAIDPWETFNRKVYTFNDTLDTWVLRPVAKGYKFVLPDVAQQGVSNFILNIYEFNSFFNSLFQGEIAGAGFDLLLFVI